MKRERFIERVWTLAIVGWLISMLCCFPERIGLWLIVDFVITMIAIAATCAADILLRIRKPT